MGIWIVNSDDTGVIPVTRIESKVDGGEPRSLLIDKNGKHKIRFEKYIYTNKNDALERLASLQKQKQTKSKRFSILKMINQ